MDNTQIKLENISKVYDRRTIIAPFDLAIDGISKKGLEAVIKARHFF